MAFKSIALLGVRGVLGPAVLTAFQEAAGFDVKILSSTAGQAYGHDTIAVDYDDVDAIAKALDGVEAVVSLVGAAGIPGQIKVIDAAIKAGVKLFIPSEFGIDTTVESAKRVKLLAKKFDIEAYLEAKKDQISYTLIYSNIFADWGLGNGFLGVDLKAKKASYFGDGKAPFVGTTLADVAKGVIGVLSDPERYKNKHVRLTSVTTSIADIVAAAEEQTGSKFETESQSFEQAEATSEKLIKEGEFLSGAYLELKVEILNGKGAGYWTGSDSEALGIKPITTAQLVKDVLSQAA